MMKRTIVEITALVLVLAFVFVSARSVEELSTEKRRLEVLYLPSGEFLDQASLGYRNLAADVLWVKTVQYYGGYRWGNNDLALFSHLVDVITDLDPQFVFAYLFGGLVIAEDLGYFEEGMAFIKKGIENNPTDWWLVFELGFLNYVYARDFETAAHYFLLASRLPGSDEITKRFAAFVAAKAGHTETSIAMWEELSLTSDNPYIRQMAEDYMEKLKKQSDTDGGNTR
jgi:tetratricopeptide (TPR) repeat protein